MNNFVTYIKNTLAGRERRAIKCVSREEAKSILFELHATPGVLYPKISHTMASLSRRTVMTSEEYRQKTA